jgi:hypothetical protein
MKSGLQKARPDPQKKRPLIANPITASTGTYHAIKFGDHAYR